MSTVFLPLSAVLFGFAAYLAINLSALLFLQFKRLDGTNSSGSSSGDHLPKTGPVDEVDASTLPDDPVNEPAEETAFRHYRSIELQRIVASLKAAAPILVAGEEGSGKSVLGGAVVKQLSDEGFTVAFVEPATPKQMLLEIAQQLGVETQTIEGKSLTAEGLKSAIANYLAQNTAFLVIDDAHVLELKFRLWLKSLKRQGVPMLLLATDPPRSDIFVNLPRIELLPLSAYAIRELMEQAALSRGINLALHDLARLQERAGGNPNLAIRAIEEEYLGLDTEAGDHHQYFDITPLVLLVGVVFVVVRFLGLGTGNQALYIFGGILAAVFLGVSRVLYGLPRDSRRIKG